MPMLMFNDDVCVRLAPFGTMVASPSTEFHDPDHFERQSVVSWIYAEGTHKYPPPRILARRNHSNLHETVSQTKRIPRLKQAAHE